MSSLPVPVLTDTLHMRQWKESVAGEYNGYEALNERKIKSSCGAVFAISKQNASKTWEELTLETT